MRLRFVAASAGNAFMTELLDALAAELRAQGADATLVFDRFPAPERDLVYATIPHELFATVPERDWPTPAQLARTVAILTEQPGTVWSATALEHAVRCGAAMDISDVGMVELRRSGIRGERLVLGYAEAWDAWGGNPATPRPLDALFMGMANRRREVHLSSYADVLAPRAVRLMLPPPAPKTETGPGFVLGREKHALLASTKTLLSIRAQIPPYFEWLRALEAIANGAVLVCEHGAGHAPLVPGEHFVSGRPESLGLLVDALVRDPERAERMRQAARDFVRAELPMGPGARRLGEVAAELASGRRASAPVPVRVASYSELARPDFTDPAAEPQPAPEALPDGEGPRRRAQILAERRERREGAAAAIREAGGDPDTLEVLAETPAYSTAEPRVTVCMPLFEQPEHVLQALHSVAVQDLDDLDLIVHDDASADDSAAVVERFLGERPWLAARLLRPAVNRGLPRARNAMLAQARAPYALMLDADNELYPKAATRLAVALDAVPQADFAFGALAVHRNGRPDGLLSAFPWDASVLPARNPVDALALVRRERVVELGGYTEDDTLHGWEDYELWVKITAAGGHGVLVDGFVGRYRRAAGSMASFSDLDQDGMRAALRSRYPAVMGQAATVP